MAHMGFAMDLHGFLCCTSSSLSLDRDAVSRAVILAFSLFARSLLANLSSSHTNCAERSRTMRLLICLFILFGPLDNCRGRVTQVRRKSKEPPYFGG
jgi:hypothetical protein